MLLKLTARSVATIAAAIAFAGTTGIVSAADVRRGPVTLPRVSEPVTSFFNPWAIADFDGDQRPDIAHSRIEGRSAAGYSFRIELQLSNGLQTAFTISTLDGSALNVTPRDVDGDNDLDLIITSGAMHRPVGVWINDGRGGFSQGDPANYSLAFWLDDPQVTSADGMLLDGAATLQDTRTPIALQIASRIPPSRKPSWNFTSAQHRNKSAVRRSADSSRAPPSLPTIF